MATTKTTKKTASNCPFLARVKLATNGKIFRETSRLMNADGEGAARAYLQRFISRPLDEVFGRPDARTTREFPVRCPACGAQDSMTLNSRDVHDLCCADCSETITPDMIREILGDWERLLAQLETAPERD